MTAMKRGAGTFVYLVLIALIAVGLGAGIVRLINGLGVTTNLSDGYPWGLWIVYDVFFIPFAAGAFMISAVTHIYNREEYHTIARPVVLAGFVGYIFVVVILLMDLGRWHKFYNILIPWYWNLHSFMLEVSLCITLYTGVLIMEVAPAILERLNLKQLLGMIRPLTVLIAGAGIVLSSVHQSSLGSLFLLMPYKLHPLWWTPLLPLLFFTSAAFSGLAMAIFVSIVSFKAFRRRLELGLLTDLAKIVSIMLGIYLVLKVGDLMLAGELGLIFSEGWLSLLFLAELVIGVVVPLVLFSRRKVRESSSRLIWGAACVLVGLALNRVSVPLLALRAPAGASYFPHWIEFAMALASVVAGVVIFTLAVHFLPVLPSVERSGRGGISSGWSRWKVISIGLALPLLTVVVVLLVGPGARAVTSEVEPVSAPLLQTHSSLLSESCLECHLDQAALSRAGADGDELARLIIEPEPPQTPHGRLNCVTCHQGAGGTEDVTAAHVGVITDPSLGDSDGCLSCHHDLPDEFPQDRLRTPHNELVHGQVVDVSCSDCHGGVGHGFDPVSGEVICSMSVCLDCHQTRQLDSDLSDCGVCHIGPHDAAVAMECRACHQSTELWPEVTMAAHPVELVDKHAEAQCFDCHQKPDFAGLEYVCSNCHQPPGEPHFGPDCDTCHTPTSFEDATLPPELHPVPLVGAHQRATCEACHVEGEQAPKYVCSNCHQSPENHLEGACDTCHTPEGWAESVASLVAQFPQISHTVDGRDDCLMCHDPAGQIKPAPADHEDRVKEQCALCHKVAP